MLAGLGKIVRNWRKRRAEREADMNYFIFGVYPYIALCVLLIGSVGYIVSLGLCAWAFASGTYSIIPACIFAFIAALLPTFFPTMVTVLQPAQVFGFFCVMMAIQLLWVLFIVPETKGVRLEDIEQALGITKSSRADS